MNHVKAMKECDAQLMLNQRGQGLSEYGIILLLILGVGMGVWFHGNARDSLEAMYSTIGTDLKSIISGTSAYEDDIETYTVYKRANGNKVGPFTFHKTSLSYAGKGYNGSKDPNNGLSDDQTIWWFINHAGYKEYKVGKANIYGTGMLQEVPYAVNNKTTDGRGYKITDEKTYTYFQATDGNTYQITYYKDNPTGTTLTLYTGDTSKKCVQPDYSGYPST